MEWQCAILSQLSILPRVQPTLVRVLVSPMQAISSHCVPADDSLKHSLRYWAYTVNELGMEDVTAQINLIHELKCKELKRGGKAGIVEGALSNGFRCTAAADSSMRSAFQREAIKP